MSEINEKYNRRGAIEAVLHSKSIFGWVYITDESGNQINQLTIKVFSSPNTLLFEGKRTKHRPDLDSIQKDNCFGFRIDLEQTIRLSDFDSLQIEVHVDRTTVYFPIGVAAKLKKAIHKAQLISKVHEIINAPEFNLTENEKKSISKIIDSGPDKSNEVIDKPEELSTTSMAVGTTSSNNISILGRKVFVDGNMYTNNNIYSATGLVSLVTATGDYFSFWGMRH